MKISNSEKAILLALVGIAAAILSIVLIAKPNYDSKKLIDSECATLQARLAELQAKQADREYYLEQTEVYKADFDELLNTFPADLNQEVTIMFMEGIKESNEFSLSSLSLGKKEQFYTLGMGGADNALSTTTQSTANTTEATTGTTEAGSTELTTETVEESSYECYRASFPVAYYGSYESIKDVMAYIASYQDRMVIDSIDISYNADANLYSGSLNLMCYAIESADRPERKVELNDIEIGVDNIFSGAASSSAAASQKLTKYDENNGAALESSYDFYSIINPATSDVSAKVVGQNGAGKEASVISNSDNSLSSLSFDFYEKDGKNYCKYTLDGSTSYEAEVTSAEDIKVLLQSSARKNDDDKVELKVTIRNTTSLPVYVKVSGDDAVNPRITIASKSGSVKVYK